MRPRTSAGLYLVATGAFAFVVAVGARHVAIEHARLVGYGVPIASIAFATALAGLVARSPCREGLWPLLLDLGTWVLPLVLLGAARRGPVHTDAWLAVIVMLKTGLVLLWLGREVATRRLSDHTAAWLLAGLAVAFFIAPLPFTRLAIKLKGDEAHYLLATVSVLRDGDMFLEDEYAGAAYAPFVDGPLGPGPHVVSARQGHLAGFHDVGLSLLALPSYWLGGWLLVLVVMAVLAGLALRELFLCARLFGAPPLATFVAAASVGFTPPFAVYATQLYPEVPGALLTIFATRRMIASTGAPNAPLAAGLSVAALPWLHVRFWPLVLSVLLAALVSWPRAGTVGRVIGPVAASAGAYALLIAVVYGRLSLSPLLLYPGFALKGWPPLGARILPAVALSQARPWLDSYDGLLLLSPVYLLAVAAMPLLLRFPGRTGRAPFAIVASYALAIGLWSLRSSAGDSPPGRFMVAVLPLLGVALACGLGRRRRIVSWLFPALAALSTAGMLVSLSEPILARYPSGGHGGPIAILSRWASLPPEAIGVPFSSPMAVSGVSFAKAGLAVLLIGLLSWAISRASTERGETGRSAGSE